MHVDQYRVTVKSDLVIDLNEPLKPTADQGQKMSLSREQPPASSAAPQMDDAEQQMRRALGLYGDSPRPRPEGERPEPAQRGGGFMQGVHRRRFVQDGEVPVTVVRRDAPDAAHAGAGAASPTSSRLQRVEATLAAESAGRERAERALNEAQAAVQALQTKIGHNDLAKNEAVARRAKRHLRGSRFIARRSGRVVSEPRLSEAEAACSEQAEEDLRAVRTELTEERRARKLAERLLRETTEEAALMATRDAGPAAEQPEPVERPPARRGRPPIVRAEPEDESEPVKWWLLPAKTAAKRR